MKQSEYHDNIPPRNTLPYSEVYKPRLGDRKPQEILHISLGAQTLKTLTLSHERFSKWGKVCREAVENLHRKLSTLSLQHFGEYNLVLYGRDPSMVCAAVD